LTTLVTLFRQFGDQFLSLALIAFEHFRFSLRIGFNHLTESLAPLCTPSKLSRRGVKSSAQIIVAAGANRALR
jgi:hypothetical protein